MLYETVEDAHFRLTSSIILYKDRPVYVLNFINNTPRMTCLDMLSQGHITVDLDKEEKLIDITPVRLGYCNIGGKAHYISRMPTRRYKQGLTSENVSCRTVDRDVLTTKELARTIMGQYPKIPVAKDAILKSCSSMAFHRCFALRKGQNGAKHFSLMYKGREVGVLKGEIFTFGQGFFHLESLLREVLYGERYEFISA